jgi:hypothetical protein
VTAYGGGESFSIISAAPSGLYAAIKLCPPRRRRSCQPPNSGQTNLERWVREKTYASSTIDAVSRAVVRQLACSREPAAGLCFALAVPAPAAVEIT